jgi:SAM-dependent methyltransferase
MDTHMESTSTSPSERELPFVVPLVCPECHGRLERDGESLACTDCHREFPFTGGFPDLIVGGRFDDAPDEEMLRHEENFNAYTTANYWIPKFRRLFPDTGRRYRLLSLGCGTGADVDSLYDAGFDCVGIDNGNRTSVWPRRRHRDSLLLANGMNLPFRDSTFDGIFCGCVFPHVGVFGDSYKVTPDYHRDRARLAQEMARVLAPGGKILVASPNRLFPADIFHGRACGCYTPRPYAPTDPFLLSTGDYRKLFLEAGCTSAKAQELTGYWGFIRSKKQLKGFLFGLPVRFVFWLVSRKSLRFLRGSPLTPWIVVLVEKEGRAAGAAPALASP